jgi:ribosomal protein L30/L7E
MAKNKIRRVRGIPTLSQLVRSTIWLLEMTKLGNGTLLPETVEKVNGS